jgi:hypothetical protein
LLHPCIQSGCVALLQLHQRLPLHASLGRHTCTCIMRLHIDDILACTPVDEEI